VGFASCSDGCGPGGRLRLATCPGNEWFLRNQCTISNAIELAWRRDLGPGLENRIEEIEHLSAVDWPMPGYKDQHVSCCDDVFVFASSFLARRAKAEHFIGRHKRTLDLDYALIKVVRDGSHARS